jgi:hypothetical protein
MDRMIKLGKLTWRDDFAGLCLQASMQHAGDYAILDLAQLGHRIGYSANFSPPHRRSEMPEWLPLGVFPDVISAKKRCAAHFLGTAYVPVERSLTPPRVKRKKSRELLLLGYMSCGTSDEKTKEQGALHE